MSTCRNFPTTDYISILTSEDSPKVCQCNRNSNGEYICSGPSGKEPCIIQDGFWRLTKGNDNNCRWWYCKTPFKIDKNNNPIFKNGRIDTSDFSDCTLTNFPYYISPKKGGDCEVKNIFTGKVVEKDLDCCDHDQKCQREDALKYKTLDVNLVSDSLNYKCDGMNGCVQTLPGLGDFTNPFCDYQCTTLEFPRNYTCINGYCQQVANPQLYDEQHGEQTWYDNEWCDVKCPHSSQVTFNCNEETNQCESVSSNEGQYSDFPSCSKACGISSSGEEKIPQQSGKLWNYIFYSIVIIINIVIIYTIIYLINKLLNPTKNLKRI